MRTFSDQARPVHPDQHVAAFRLRQTHKQTIAADHFFQGAKYEAPWEFHRFIQVIFSSVPVERVTENQIQK